MGERLAMPGCRAEYRQKFKIKGFRFGGGETTQRIAAALFQAVQRYKYGIHFASFYLPGDFVPHVRIMNTATSQFLSTPSARRTTVNYLIAGFDYWLFLSTPSARRTTVNYLIAGFDYWLFLSTPSVRRATVALTSQQMQVIEFLSTPSVRRATFWWHSG